MTTTVATHPIVAARDKLAAWLPLAADMLEPPEPENLRWQRDFDAWEKKLRLYERLCKLHPEETA